MSTLTDLLDKAQEQLASAQKEETANVHNFELMEQSLEDSIKYATADMSEAKKSKAAAAEAKAVAEGDLAVTSKDLEEDTATLAATKQACATAAEDYEATTASRKAELEALAKAKSVIAESTGGAESITYGLNQVSLLQLQRMKLSSGADLANFEAVHFVRELARKQHAPELAQLAMRMMTAMRTGGHQGQRQFDKVKSLIMDLIEKLSKEAEADASHKAYCDKELAETEAKIEESTSTVDALSTKIDSASAASMKLKEEVATLEKELAELAKTQADMDTTRQETHATFVKDKAEMESGIEGVKTALKVLKEYYAKGDKAHAAASGAGDGIISLLEVCESDFTEGLSQMVASEESAQASYETMSKENSIAKVTKEQSVKYKTKEAAGLDKELAELSSDRSGEQTELDAKTEYLAKLKEMCVAKPEPYAEKKARREAEIAGLKEALSILDGESLLQSKVSRRAFRR